MNKNEMIIEIMNLYDELESLRRTKNTPMNNDVLVKNDGNQVDEREQRINRLMIDIGKKSVLEKASYSWKHVECKYDEDSDIYKVTSFDKWAREKYPKDRIPEFMSYDFFLKYFDEEIRRIYENEKTYALNEAKGIENVEEE